MKRPNIVLIMSDNQSADMPGCSGIDELHTPHLDQLAGQGVRFSNAYCTNAMCSPCRASVLTGLMPSQHGVHNWLDDRLMDQWPENWSAIAGFENLPMLLKQAGYTTALIGKFHLGVPFEPQLGFDHWVTFPHGHTTHFQGNEVIDQGERYRVPGHSVEFFTDKTVAFLEEQADRDEPFFAFVPYNGPYGHWPSIKGQAQTQFDHLYDTADLHSIPREGVSPDVITRFGLRVEEGGVREQFKGPLLLPNNLEALRNYFAQVSLIDDGVGRIMATLERLDLDQETIVIFTSDHGFSLGHNGVWGHGAAAFPSTGHRASYHIPLIAGGAGIAQGEVYEGLVSQIDLFPTIATLAGVEAAPSLPSAARDLTPALKGAGLDEVEAVFYEQEETRVIRTKRWVYAQRFAGAPSFPLSDTLYCVDEDPEERVNLIDVAEYAEVLASLRTRLSAHFDRYTAPEFDLWRGGTAVSNVSYDKLWKNAWGADWAVR
ncbi:MAG: sulfatase-like hydrolase/transferase [Rhodobacteraceae bacterium]|nr:sulfatase-like hydrolase/transferase [Paracoccaceae bacterium]